MRMYACAALITITSTAIIIKACLFHQSATRAVPINLIQQK